MKPIIPALFLSWIMLLAALNTRAQTCDGSLGDPVINQDFGSGPNPGPPLAPGMTNMLYTTSSCPADGQYTITNSMSGPNNCHLATWHNVVSDHTGNPNGYMMLVNASANPSVFFTQPAVTSDGQGLCASTTYQFSAYILNLLKLEGSQGASEPDITFSVETTDGQVLASYDTGTIPPTENPTWVKDSLYFTTPNTFQSVIVKMTNNAAGGNGNDLILDDIVFRACGPVIEAGFSTATNSSAQPLCQGASAQYTLTAKVIGNNNPSYQWQVYHAATGWIDTVGQTTSQLIVKFTNAYPGTYQYRLGIASANNISSDACRTYGQPLTVNVSTNPVVVGVNPTQAICEGDSLTLAAAGGVTYQWSGPNLPATSLNPVTIKNITLSDAGKYTVIAYNQYGCPSTPASTMVTVNPKAIPAVNADSVIICQGNSAVLGASGGVAYQWSPGITLSDSTSANPTASPLDTTIYTVKVSNSYGCFATKTVKVNVLKTAVANAGTNKVIFEGQSVQLNATQKYGNLFSWTPTTGLSDPNVLDPVASPHDDITYTLHVTSTANCGIDSSSVFVKVYKKITIPNTFSPNGDNVNDYWDIDALITYPGSLMLVFDRYGQQVYRSIGYSKPWNGKYNGRLLPAGTYYYVLDLKNNTPKISGWVQIVR